MHRFENRKDAGRRLAAALREYARRRDVLVLALPRGGVPVAHEVAQMLRVPLDTWIVRKLPVPGHEEFAMGAIALGDQEYLDRTLMTRLRIPEDALGRILARETQELQRLNHLYRGGRPLPRLDGLTVILTDDGLATGASMRVAIQSVRNAGARHIVVAVPVAEPAACAQLTELADAVVCLAQPEPFRSLELWYEDFTQTADDEVNRLLAAQSVQARPRPGLRP